jgi:hypothetical protein
MANYPNTVALAQLLVMVPAVIVEQFKDRAYKRNMTIRAAAAEALVSWIAAYDAEHPQDDNG